MIDNCDTTPDSTPATLSPCGKRKRLCVISPCFNEEEVVDLFHRELKAALDSMPDLDYVILLVDDGSTDATLERLNAIAAKDRHVRVCSLSRNFGHQIALSAGLDHANGDAVILMDSDLQHPPRMIPELVARWQRGDDVVLTVRQETADATWFKRFTSNAFYWSFNKLADVQLVYGAADFCLLSRRVYRALREMPERHRFLRGLVAWAGYPRSILPYLCPARAAGKSKYTLPRMLKLAAEALFSFTARPIYLAMQLGILSVLAGFAYLAYIIIGYFYWHDFVPGWSSAVSSTLLLGGFQLLVMGLVGSYVARIFEQVKGRPLYLLKQTPQRCFGRTKRRIGKGPHYLLRRKTAARGPQGADHPFLGQDVRRTA